MTTLVELLPLQPGAVLNTCADASDLAQATGFQPGIALDEGLGRFIAWFRDYYPLRIAHSSLASGLQRRTL